MSLNGYFWNMIIISFKKRLRDEQKTVWNSELRILKSLWAFAEN
jgi:hypothetical protein